jgi:hypothetical protein
MDLTAAIHLKIENLRSAKTSRYNTLAISLEREVATLTQRSALLFTKLEDALEADVLDKLDDFEDMKKFKEEDTEMDVIAEEEEEAGKGGNGDSPVRDKHTDTTNEIYDVDDDKDIDYDQDIEGKYYDHPSESKDYFNPVISARQASTSLYAGIRPPSRTPSLSSKAPPKQDDAIPSGINSNTAISTVNDAALTSKSTESKPPVPIVSFLRSEAQKTQALLAKKHISLTQLRQKHDLAMKRLDKLQSDLEKVSQKWEAEERARIQTESTTALGKRKREEEDAGDASQKRWKNWGKKGVEWGVLFGVGVVSAVGLSKFSP